MDKEEQSRWLAKNAHYLRTPRVLDGHLHTRRDFYPGTIAIRLGIALVVILTSLLVGYNIWK